MPRTKRLLAAHGVKFTSFYDSVALCCPARAALLTGRYAHSTSVYGNAPPDGGAVTFRHRGDDLADAGGLAAPRRLPHRPLRQVPERLQGRVRPARVGHLHHLGALLGRARDTCKGVEKNYPLTTYMPNFMGTRTAQFIRSVPRTGRSSRTTPRTPRTPTRAPSRATHRMHVCWHCHGWPTPDFNERGVSDKPAFERPAAVHAGQSGRPCTASARVQVRTLQSVDVKVGRIVAALRDTGRLHNTIIVFMSDNGVMWGSHRWSPTAKRNPYRKASRMPLIIRYDAARRRRPGSSRGSSGTSTSPRRSPTSPACRRRSSVEGTSFAPILRDPSHPWSRTLLLENFTRRRDARARSPATAAFAPTASCSCTTGQGVEELYDERRDPFELHNIAGKPAAAATAGRACGRPPAALCTSAPAGLHVLDGRPARSRTGRGARTPRSAAAWPCTSCGRAGSGAGAPRASAAGGVMAVRIACAASAPVPAGISPTRPAIRWMWVSTGITGTPRLKSRTQLAVLGPTPGSATSQSIASRGRHASRATPGRARRGPRSTAWMRGAFWTASPPGRRASTRSASGASRTSAHLGNRSRMRA